MNNRETRSITNNITTDNRHVSGYAILFNDSSKMLCEGGREFVEIIDSKAIDETVLNRSDIFCLFNHDTERVLARNRYNDVNASLKLTIDDKGLKYEFDAPHSADGDYLLEMINRGDLSGSSFCFTCSDDTYIYDDELCCYIRTVNKIDELFDVSPVWSPAYNTENSLVNRSINALETERAKYYNDLINRLYDAE